MDNDFERAQANVEVQLRVREGLAHAGVSAAVQERTACAPDDAGKRN